MADRNRDESCAPKAPVKLEPVIIPTRPAPKCDPATEPIPEIFYRPGPPEPPAQKILKLPKPYPVPNVDQLAQCADVEGAGPEGDNVFVAAGTFTVPLDWARVPHISPSQLNWIAERTDTELRFLATDPSEIEFTFLKFTEAQSAWAKEEFETLKEQANALAVAAAQAQLDCVWRSTYQSVECPHGAITTPGTLTNPVENPSIVPAGLYSSSVSQEDADAQALAEAFRRLTCVWLNQEVTVTCLDAGFAEEVPVDPEDASPRRIGVVTVPAGIVDSPLSQQDANEQARILALGRLVCRYPNQEITITCDDIGKLNTHNFGPSDITTGTPGSSVTIPAGYLTSEESTEAANAQAYAQALFLLQCLWLNQEVTAQCPSQTVDAGLPTERLIAPAPAGISGTFSVTIPAGVFSSDASQDDADGQASIAALASLSCKYCNDVVPPVCIPDNFTPTVLPIPEEAVESYWSADATPGVPAGMFCMDDAQTAVDLADQVGSVPIVSKPNDLRCVYINDELKAGCIADESIGVLGLFDSTSGAELSSALSSPDPFADDPSQRYRVIAAGTIRHTEDKTPVEWQPSDINRHKNYANELARRLLFATLQCQFGNKEKTFTCAADKQKPNVHASSTDNILVRANTFTSSTSQSEADASAAAFGLNSLNCFYLSPKSRFLCATGANTGQYPTTWTLSSDTRVYGNGKMTRVPASKFGGIAGEVTVSNQSIGHTSKPIEFSEGSFQSYVSQADANQQMRTAALTQLTCHWRNVNITVLCGASGSSVLSPTQSTASGLRFGNGKIGTDTVHSTSTGSSSRPVIMAANIFDSTESPEAANELALIQAINSLNCFFLNGPISAVCGIPPGSHFHPNAITESSVAGAQFSSTTSQAEADNVASLVAKSQLKCSYGNDTTQADPCPDDTSPSGITSIPSDFVEDYGSTTRANQTAKMYANALRACTSPGAPGGNGAQTNCSGQCYGYYS